MARILPAPKNHRSTRAGIPPRVSRQSRWYYSPSGSFGDPTLASVDKGSRLLAAILEDMIEAAG
jgi:creatinine amidohydrolase/Fe(II)-dependent formamide hydrolase-like protein